MRTDSPARFIVGGAIACALAGGLASRGAAAPADSAPAAGDAPPATQKIAVDLRGPLAVVRVTRTRPPERPPPAPGGWLAVALPDRAALLSVELDDHGRWRALGGEKPTAAAGPRAGAGD